MNRDLFIKVLLVVVGTLLALNLIVSMITAPPLSYAGKQKFEHIRIVPMAMGMMLGFFDTKEGKLWFYNLEKEKWEGWVQLKKLGEPLVEEKFK